MLQAGGMRACGPRLERLVLSLRYFNDQKTHDAVAANQLKDDFKRKGREFKERAAEAEMLESLYQVGITVRLTCWVYRAMDSTSGWTAAMARLQYAVARDVPCRTSGKRLSLLSARRRRRKSR